MITKLIELWSRFWKRLGSTTPYGRQLDWENIPPIPVVIEGYIGANSTGKPYIWPYSDNSGYVPKYDTLFSPSARTNGYAITDGNNDDVLGSGQKGVVTIYAGAGATATITLDNDPIVIPEQTPLHLGMCEGLINVASAGGTTYVSSTIHAMSQEQTVAR